MSLIKCKISKRGKSQIELKIDYPLLSFSSNDEKIKNFFVSCYIFIPSRLGINKDNYTNNNFFSDLSSYTRFEVASLSLQEILDKKNDLSPLTRIENDIANFTEKKDSTINNIVYELRTLYNIGHSRLKEKGNSLKTLKHKIAEAEDETRFLFDDVVNSTNQIIERLHAMREFFYTINDDFSLFKCYQWVDEGFSVDLERFCWKVYESASKVKDYTLEKSCLNIIEKQNNYRKEQNYTTFVYKYNNKNNESFIFRMNNIKKWAESVLYVNVARSRNTDRWGQLFYAIAAGLAMTVSLIFTIIALNQMQNQAMLWLIGGVIVYMLKDRMKASLQVRSSSILPKLISNREMYIVDPKDRKKVGRIRDWVEFTTKENLPAEIRKQREFGKTWLDKLLATESIIYFKRNVKINNKIILNHKRLINLVDIIRFDLRRTFFKMDKSDETLFVKNGDKLEKVIAERVYHFNMILKLEEGKKDKTPIIYRYRIIANQDDGIIRLEKIENSNTY